MGLFNSFLEWNSARQERRMNDAQAQNICPECRGRGIMSMAPSEFYYINYAECPGCNGTGSYADWAAVNEQE